MQSIPNRSPGLQLGISRYTNTLCVCSQEMETTTAWRKYHNSMYHVSPNDVERYYLRLLLLHVKGPLSFEDIKTVNNHKYDSYLSAARALNLLADDNEWNSCLQKAALCQFPRQLRFLFAVICVYCTPSD